MVGLCGGLVLSDQGCNVRCRQRQATWRNPEACETRAKLPMHSWVDFECEPFLSAALFSRKAWQGEYCAVEVDSLPAWKPERLWNDSEEEEVVVPDSPLL